MSVKIADGTTIGQVAFEILHRLNAGWSVDELLLHPTDAVELCRAVRRRLGKQLKDDEVLRALLNCRKQGKL